MGKSRWASSCEKSGVDMNAAKEAFAQYLNDASLDSRQIYFVNQIVEYIVHNGMMKDLSVLQEAPFTDHGSIVEVSRICPCGLVFDRRLSGSMPMRWRRECGGR